MSCFVSDQSIPYSTVTFITLSNEKRQPNDYLFFYRITANSTLEDYFSMLVRITSRSNQVGA